MISYLTGDALLPRFHGSISRGRMCHAIFSESRERRSCPEYHPVVVCNRRVGRTEGGRGGGGRDVGGCAWRRRTRQGIATLFRRCRFLGDLVTDGACRSVGIAGLFRDGL